MTPWEIETITHGYGDGLPLNSRGYEPIGGDMGVDAGSFIVTEIPAYEPCGKGEHVYLWVEKRGHSSQDVIRAAERFFGVKEPAIGCAGKKDANAITRQWISVQTHLGDGDVENCVKQMNEISWLKVLQHTRHTNKLRMGHLKGNHFDVLLENVQLDDHGIESACEVLSREGFINYFGYQRFGIDRENIANGWRLMGGVHAPRHQRLIYESAIQSAVFNLAAGRRFIEYGFGVFEGDVLKKRDAGCFVCTDAVTDNARAQRGEVGVTLALPGKKVMHGLGYTEEIEERAWSDLSGFWMKRLELADTETERFFSSLNGDRRLMRVYPQNLCFKRQPNSGISVGFALPSGSYATVFLRHLCGHSFSR